MREEHKQGDRIGPRPERVARDEVWGYEVRYNRHPKRANNFKVAEMYDCYKDGMSLSVIAKLYKRSRQAVYGVFRSRGYRLRSKRLKGKTERYGISFTLDAYGRLRGSNKEGERVYLHRMVWEEANGPVPPRHQLHFKNGDKLDVRIENLELVPYELLSKKFNPTGRNQYTKRLSTCSTSCPQVRKSSYTPSK